MEGKPFSFSEARALYIQGSKEVAHKQMNGGPCGWIVLPAWARSFPQSTIVGHKKNIAELGAGC